MRGGAWYNAKRPPGHDYFFSFPCMAIFNAKKGFTSLLLRGFGFRSIAMRGGAGFTLIELLVVIAIIGLLASVVLASLGSARQKARDARRISDIRQIQTALELFFASNNEYPWGVETSTGAGSYTTLAPAYIPSIPADPLGRAYQYHAFITTTGTACTSAAAICVFYHLGITLEDINNPALDSDRDANLGIFAGDSVDGISNADNCGSAAVPVTSDLCYDVTP